MTGVPRKTAEVRKGMGDIFNANVCNPRLHGAEQDTCIGEYLPRGFTRSHWLVSLKCLEHRASQVCGFGKTVCRIWLSVRTSNERPEGVGHWLRLAWSRIALPFVTALAVAAGRPRLVISDRHAATGLVFVFIHSSLQKAMAKRRLATP